MGDKASLTFKPSAVSFLQSIVFGIILDHMHAELSLGLGPFQRYKQLLTSILDPEVHCKNIANFNMMKVSGYLQKCHD